MPSGELFIGLISGTSVDAIDCALCDFSRPESPLLASHSEPVPAGLRDRLLAHCSPQATTLPALGSMDIELGELFARAAHQLMRHSRHGRKAIRAIGSHGQTLYHSPDSRFPFTLQIADPNVIAARTGITTIADFRRMDMALGGQGAPLAPLFHQSIFQSPGRHRAVLNLGGIANLTFLPKEPGQPVTGLDTGPASGLMDAWILRHRQKPFDGGGQWALSGSVDNTLLQCLLADPYFSRPAPKSTGREYFSLQWLDHRLQQSGPTPVAARDVQATLLEFSARTVVDGFRLTDAIPEQLVVSGGGVYNDALLQRISALAPRTDVISSADLGVPPDWVEAMTFAWLAWRRV
ncbi:MAG: anhydro-N-acetylmuramic acid kinase, partial [Pseudomonadota bacterium]